MTYVVRQFVLFFGNHVGPYVSNRFNFKPVPARTGASGPLNQGGGGLRTAAVDSPTAAVHSDWSTRLPVGAHGWQHGSGMQD